MANRRLRVAILISVGDGRVTKTVDADGHETDTVYGPSGKVSQSVDYIPKGDDSGWLAQTTKYYYDGAGNLIETEYPNGTQSVTVYDVDGRATLATGPFDPQSGDPIPATRTVYDGAGRVIESQRLANVSITVSIDGEGVASVAAVSASAGLIAAGMGTPPTRPSPAGFPTR